MIDTHCHLTFPDYRNRVDLVLKRAASRGVTGALTVATNTQDAPNALALATHHPNVWCSAGVHPLYSDGPDGAAKHDWNVIAQTANHPRCVAFGELGLDNHYDHPPHDVQRRVLDQQLDMIAAHPHRPKPQGDPDAADPADRGKPVILHCRDAFDDLIPILRDSNLPPDRFVFHCFTAGPREIDLLLDFGAFVSFTGVLTYNNAPEVRDAAKRAPLDRVMVETDAPFLSPQPVRKQRPNEPAHVLHVARTLADLHDLPLEQLHAKLNDNTRAFFNIDTPTATLDTTPLEPLGK